MTNDVDVYELEQECIPYAQGQGTVFISRINNASILDKSSREGIIENESFKLLKDALIRIISILEKDRAYIARSFKIYDDRVNHKEKTKQEGSQIAKSVLSGKKDKNYKAQKEKMESLAKTVQYFEEEREELITELKLLRALATNGLITTSIVHDLKSINALLVNRVEPMRMAIENNNKMLIERNLNDLYKNDQFLKSWITVVTNQSKKDNISKSNKWPSDSSSCPAPVYPYIGGKTPQLATCIRNCPGFHLWIKTHPCKGRPLVLSVFQMLFRDRLSNYLIIIRWVHLMQYLWIL